MKSTDFYDDPEVIRLVKAAGHGDVNKIKRLVRDHNVDVNTEGRE